MQSEHVAIARGILATRMGLTPQIDAVVEALRKQGKDADASREEAIRLILRRKGLGETVEALATLVEASYRNLEEEVGRYSVVNHVERVTALARVLRADRTEANLVASFCRAGRRTRRQASKRSRRWRWLTIQRLPSRMLTLACGAGPFSDAASCRAFTTSRHWARARRRPTSRPGWRRRCRYISFAGTTTWKSRVRQRVREYRQRMGHAAWRVVRELGLQGELFEMMVKRRPRSRQREGRLSTRPRVLQRSIRPCLSRQPASVRLRNMKRETSGTAHAAEHFGDRARPGAGVLEGHEAAQAP